VTSSAAFRAPFSPNPEKHRRAAELIAGEPVPEADEETLPRLLTDLMRDVGAPRGLRELGYDDGDVDDLVTGALKQQRMLSIAPAEVGPDQLAEIFSSSMENWTG
jgi:hydroxyacid-oxoacid transhydrogenase